MRTPHRFSVRRDVARSARQLVLAHFVKVRLLRLDQEPLDRQLALGIIRTQRLELLHKLLGNPSVGIGKLFSQNKSQFLERTRSTNTHRSDRSVERRITLLLGERRERLARCLPRMQTKRLVRRLHLKERIRDVPLLLRDRLVRLLQENAKFLSAPRHYAPSREIIIIRLV